MTPDSQMARRHRKRADRIGRRRALAAVAVAGVGALLAAGCGSGSSGQAQPAGLDGHQAGSQGSAADRLAASILPPAAGTYLAGRTRVALLGSTTPPDGDVNPYAIWPVTRTVGSVRAGDILVDNFNNPSTDQGTGTTIVDVRPGAHVHVFAQLPAKVAGCPGGVGLTTAMVQLRTGWVIVGSLPSANGRIGTAAAGCLLVLSPTGHLAKVIAAPYIDGPWDAVVVDRGSSASLFVDNTLPGITATSGMVRRGTVVRLSLSESASAPPSVTAETQVAGGLAAQPSAAAFVQGPTGLAVDEAGTLYIADNPANDVTAVAHAVTAGRSDAPGRTVSRGGQLANPLGLTVAPDGDLLVANGTNGKIVEISPTGHQVGEIYANHDVGQDPPGNGDLFDLAIDRTGGGILFVEDDTNTLALLQRGTA
jgi:hypothetical protein